MSNTQCESNYIENVDRCIIYDTRLFWENKTILMCRSKGGVNLHEGIKLNLCSENVQKAIDSSIKITFISFENKLSLN